MLWPGELLVGQTIFAREQLKIILDQRLDRLVPKRWRAASEESGARRVPAVPLPVRRQLRFTARATTQQ